MTVHSLLLKGSQTSHWQGAILVPNLRLARGNGLYWTGCFFMPQDLAEIQVEQPQKEDNYQEYTELENLDGFRFEADIYI